MRMRTSVYLSRFDIIFVQRATRWIGNQYEMKGTVSRSDKTGRADDRRVSADRGEGLAPPTTSHIATTAPIDDP